MSPTRAALLSVCLASVPAAAQTSGYAGQQDRPVKALSAEETADLLAGRCMGLARAGELNHFPGPAHVIGMADALGLSPDQRQAVQASFDRMEAAAKPLGAELVRRETALDEAFREHGPTRSELSALTSSIAAVQGELRAIHLSAHVETKLVLTPEQVSAYDRLRGYSGPPAGEPAHHRAHPG